MEYTFTTVDGRPCAIPVPPRDLSDLERYHHDCDCACALCAERKTPMDPIISMREDDVVILDGDALTAAGMRRGAAMQEIARLVTLYRRDHPRATEGEAQHRILETHPQLRADYAGVPASVDDQLRRHRGRSYVVADGVSEVRVDYTRTYGGVGRSDLLAPGDGVKVTWGYSPVVGDQVPQRIRFDKTIFTHWGRVDIWLKEKGLPPPVRKEERFDAFLVELADPGQQRAEGDRVLARAGARALAQAGGGDVKAQLRALIAEREEASAEQVLMEALNDQPMRQALIPLLLELLELE